MTTSYNAERYLLLILDEGRYFALYEKGANSIKRGNIFELLELDNNGNPVTFSYQLSFEDGSLTVSNITSIPTELPNKAVYDFRAKDGHPHFDGTSVVVGIGDVRNIANNPNPRPDVHRYNLLDSDVVFKGNNVGKLEIWYKNRQVVAI